MTQSGLVGRETVCWEASGKVFLAKKEIEEERAPFCPSSSLCLQCHSGSCCSHLLEVRKNSLQAKPTAENGGVVRGRTRGPW